MDGGREEVFHFAKFNFTLTKFFLKNFLEIIAIRNLTDKNSCLLVVYSGYNLFLSLKGKKRFKVIIKSVFSIAESLTLFTPRGFLRIFKRNNNNKNN